MSARLELCGALLIAAALVLWAWQNRHRERKRREMREAAVLAEIAEMKRQQAQILGFTWLGKPKSIVDSSMAEPWLWRSVPSKPLGGGTK